MELQTKDKSYYLTIGMMGFRGFLISEQSETDRELNTVMDKIQRTKKRILFKKLTRALAILDDRERSTS
jgi:hypothetical protein